LIYAGKPMAVMINDKKLIIELLKSSIITEDYEIVKEIISSCQLSKNIMSQVLIENMNDRLYGHIFYHNNEFNYYVSRRFFNYARYVNTDHIASIQIIKNKKKETIYEAIHNILNFYIFHYLSNIVFSYVYSSTNENIQGWRTSLMFRG